MSFRRSLRLFAVLGCLGTGRALAQESAAPLSEAAPPSGPPASQGLQVRLGAGVLAIPDYLGSRTYRAQPLPYVDATYGDFAALNYQDGLTLNAVRLGGLTAGPSLRVRFGQDESDNRRVLRGIGNVGTAVEAGAFAAYEAGSLRFRAVAGQDIAGGHKGFVAELGATYTTAVFGTAAGPWLLAAGPTLSLADGRYERSYFGIDPAQAARSGRPVYRPGGGAEGVGVAATLILPITRTVAITAVAALNRLLSDAAQSPLVRGGVGSANQLTGGVFLTYQIL
jgi:outer membrane scaffolding protein for murein synthesis (MipA/OmpV family)